MYSLMSKNVRKSCQIVTIKPLCTYKIPSIHCEYSKESISTNSCKIKGINCVKMHTMHSPPAKDTRTANKMATTSDKTTITKGAVVHDANKTKNNLNSYPSDNALVTKTSPPRKETCNVCGICVRDNDDGLQCDQCQTWIHAACEGILIDEYNRLSQDDKQWSCALCSSSSSSSKSKKVISAVSIRSSTNNNDSQIMAVSSETENASIKPVSNDPCMLYVMQSLDRINQRLDEVEKLQSAVSALQVEAESSRKTREDVGDLHNRVDQLSSDVNDIKENINFYTDELKSADNIQKSVRDSAQLTAVNRAAIESYDHHIRRSDIIIQGLPYLSTETNDNIRNDVIELATSVGLPMEQRDIDVAHRLPRQMRDRNGKPFTDKSRIIVKKFNSRWLKDKFIRSVKDKKNIKASVITRHQSSNATLYVNDNLSASTAKLFYAARQLVKTKKLFRAWTTDCKVHVKVKESDTRPTVVLNMEQLEVAARQ